MITTIIAAMMYTAGILLAIYIYKTYYKEPDDEAIYSANSIAKTHVNSPRAEARSAAASLEYNARKELASLGIQDEAQMAIALADGGVGFGRNGSSDPVAVTMMMGAIDSNMPTVNEALRLTSEQRHAIAKDFANTHLGKIASFVHSIDRDGKLIVSADAISFLSMEYDPIFLPGGLVGIVVKDEIESSLFKSLLSGTPLYIQNEDTKEVARVDFEQLKKIVKVANIDELISNITTIKEQKEELESHIKRLQNESNKQVETIRVLQEDLKSAREIAAANSELVKAVKMMASSGLKNEESEPRSEMKPSPASKELKASSTAVSNGHNEVIAVDAEIDIMASEIEQSKGTISNKKSSVKLDDSEANTISAPSNMSVKKTLVSDFIDGVFEDVNVWPAIINQPAKWKDYGIGLVYVDKGVARVYFDKKLVSLKCGSKADFDLKFDPILVIDDATDEGYFSLSNLVKKEVGAEMRNQFDSLVVYTKANANKYITMIDEIGWKADSRYGKLSEFISGKSRFKSLSELSL